MTDSRLHAWAARHGISDAALRELVTLYDVEPTGPASDATGEAPVQAELRITAARLGGALWRNNSGAAVDKNGRMVRYGLENISSRLNTVFKSSDLIGVHRGRFVAVECKAPGWRGPRTEHEEAQANFLRKVESLGGIGMFCTSVGQFLMRVNQP